MWSRSHSGCVVCGTTKTKHCGKGLCYPCYMKSYAEKQQKKLSKYKRKWYLKNHDRMLLKNKLRREADNYDSKRDDVLNRDGHKCRKCGKTSDLCVHHEDRNGRNSTVPNNDMANLVTLCRPCHIAVHRAELLAAKRSRSTNRWSLNHKCCIECGRTDRRHGARGKCATCYAKEIRESKGRKMDV